MRRISTHETPVPGEGGSSQRAAWYPLGDRLGANGFLAHAIAGGHDGRVDGEPSVGMLQVWSAAWADSPIRSCSYPSEAIRRESFTG